MGDTNASGAAFAESAGAWVIADRVAYVDAQDLVVVLELSAEGSVPMALTGPGSSIWRAVDGTRGSAEIVDEVARAYGQPAAEVGAVVEEFLRQLESQGLLRRI